VTKNIENDAVHMTAQEAEAVRPAEHETETVRPAEHETEAVRPAEQENHISQPFNSVLIIGVGLIGGSVAAALKALPQAPHIRGIDLDAHALEAALEAGYIDEGALPTDERVALWLGENAAAVGAEGAADAEYARSGDSKNTNTNTNTNNPCDLIVLATPVSSAQDWFERIEASNFAGVITDVASTKGLITTQASAALSKPERYLPGHPMAGSEVNGIEGARANLFAGAHWIVCPDAATEPAVFTKMHEFITALGARSITLPREEHDNIIAIVSHVPHMIASALVQLAGAHAQTNQEIFRLAAGGFKDTTRIAAGSPDLWCGIALDNKEAVAQGLQELSQIIGSFESSIKTADARSLNKLLANAADLRKAIPATWVPDSARLVEVRIPMANRSGVIAEVTGMAGKVGCNIQSIDIDHINEETAILEIILTDEGDIGRFSALLLDGGFDVSFRPLTPQE